MKSHSKQSFCAKLLGAVAAAILFAILLAIPVQAAAQTRTIPTSGGNRSVTLIEIPMDASYTITALSARHTFNEQAVPFSRWVEHAQQNAGADTIVFPINFLDSNTFEIVGGLFGGGRHHNYNWFNDGVGFAADNRMTFFSGHFPEDRFHTAFNPYPRLVENSRRVVIEARAYMPQTWLDGRVLRAFMGQLANGTLIVGHVSGTSMSELQDIAMYLNFVNATNIDGGASTALWRNGTTIITPSRNLSSVALITSTSAPQLAPPTPPAAPPPPTPPPQPAVDAPSEWAVPFVTRANSVGLIPTGFGTRYTAAITRAEFSALAVAMFERSTGTPIMGRATFNDTTNVNVQKMGYLDVVRGVGGGNFNPSGAITREEAAVILSRLAAALNSPMPHSGSTFADNAAASGWALDAIGQMQRTGIMTGVGSNRFDPRGSYTREQSIITMVRMWDMIGEQPQAAVQLPGQLPPTPPPAQPPIQLPEILPPQPPVQLPELLPPLRPDPPALGVWHVVQPGEDIMSIAMLHYATTNTETINHILRENPIITDVNNLQVGWELLITPMNIGIGQPAPIPTQPQLLPPQMPVAPDTLPAPAGSVWHVVQVGDSLASIAMHYFGDINPAIIDHILHTNPGITNLNLLQVGWQLLITPMIAE